MHNSNFSFISSQSTVNIEIANNSKVSISDCSFVNNYISMILKDATADIVIKYSGYVQVDVFKNHLLTATKQQSLWQRGLSHVVFSTSISISSCIRIVAKYPEDC